MKNKKHPLSENYQRLFNHSLDESHDDDTRHVNNEFSQEFGGIVKEFSKRFLEEYAAAYGAGDEMTIDARRDLQNIFDEYCNAKNWVKDY